MTKGAVLVLGGRSDIGLAVAHAFAAEGHPVMLAARRVETLETARADLALGLMAIKPHLGLGLVLYALLKRRWDVLGVAIVVTLASFALATLAFGPGIWPAFLSGARDASTNISNGLYPMNRMTSVFAMLKSYGLPRDTALAAQGVSVLIAVGVIVASHLRKHAPGATLGLSLVATLAVSPYNYDYDLPIFGIGLALLLPHLAGRLRRIEFLSLACFYWIAAGSGLAAMIDFSDASDTEHLIARTHIVPTIAGAAYLIVLLLLTRILFRARTKAPAAVPSAAKVPPVEQTA